jgi:hypothetical protein
MHAQHAWNGCEAGGFCIRDAHDERVGHCIETAHYPRLARFELRSDSPLLFADLRPPLPRRFAAKACARRLPSQMNRDRIALHFHDVLIGNGSGRKNAKYKT